MPGNRRERLFHKVMRLREIEHRAAAAAASRALDEAARSRQLAQRAAALALGYGDLAEVATAHELAARRIAGERMRGIAVQTGDAADHADALAETRVAGEQKARRRREAIEEARDRLRHEAAQARPGGELAPAAGLARFLKNDPANQRGS